MSRLVGLISKNSKAACSLARLSMTNHQSRVSTVLFKNQMRSLATKPAEASTVTNAEFDKPAWERNDRYVISMNFSMYFFGSSTEFQS